MIKYKYPRTCHVPYSKGTTSEDRLFTAKEMEYFHDKNIIVTDKLDGECTTIYPSKDGCHARSLDGRPHPSQDWVRHLHSLIRFAIHDGYRVCGENLYGRHAIFYDKLTTFFYIFSVWNEKNIALSWKDTVEYVEYLNLELEGSGMKIETVPVLYKGLWDEEKIKACWTGKSLFSKEQEGYVIRNADSFSYPQVSDTKHEMPVFVDVAKYVRAGWSAGIKGDWRRSWTKNHLAG